MKEVVVGSIVACEEVLLSPMISMLIINTHGEILLQKKRLATTNFILWETPYLLPHSQEEAALLTVERFLANHGFNGTAHEAFAFTSNQKARHIIIAIIEENALITASLDSYDGALYRSIHEIMIDAQENPNSYASWLHDSLDGVSLYLKNLLKQSTMLMHTRQSEM